MGSNQEIEKYEKIVIDTTILLASVITPGGAADAAVKKAQLEYQIVLTRETLQELRDKTKSASLDDVVSREDREKLCRRIEKKALLVENTFKVEVCRDREDNMMIEAALSSGAKQVVAYDKDLRDMKEYQGIHFHSAAEFLGLERSLDQKREVFRQDTPPEERENFMETLRRRYSITDEQVEAERQRQELQREEQSRKRDGRREREWES